MVSQFVACATSTKGVGIGGKFRSDLPFLFNIPLISSRLKFCNSIDDNSISKFLT